MNANPVSLTDPAVSGDVRIWLRTEGFAALLTSTLLYWRSGSSWWLFFALLLTPDLAMLTYLVNSRIGAIAYNIFHSYFLPLALASTTLVPNQTHLWPYVLIWTAHIGLDRVLGYGLKYPTAFRSTHLGVIGR